MDTMLCLAGYMRVKKCVLKEINATARLALSLMAKYASKNLMYLEFNGKPMNLMGLFTLLGHTQSKFDYIINRLVQAGLIAFVLAEDLELILINPYIFADHRMTSRQECVNELIFMTENTNGKYWKVPSVEPKPRKAARYAIDKIKRWKDGK